MDDINEVDDEILEKKEDVVCKPCCNELERLTVFGASFWDIWIQKCFRNIASVKYQWLMLLYIPIIWGMFHTNVITQKPWISEVVGLGFLGGGFITLALGRIIAKTRLTEETENYQTLNTDK